MKFKLLKETRLEPKAKVGDTVYYCVKPRYGVDRDDERAFGYECVAVTLDPDGGYPFFVVARHDLERIEEGDVQPKP